MAETWNEKSTRIVTVSFFDEDSLPTTPISATYRIDTDKGVSIVPVTTISSLGPTIDILITSTQNALVNPKLATELHKLTVEFDYGTNPVKHGTADFSFNIRNLLGVV